MKKYTVLVNVFSIILLAFTAISYGAEYKVNFDRRPEISKRYVYSKGFEIGVVRNIYLTPNNEVIVEIEVYSDYDKIFRNRVVLYVENGRLMVSDLGETAFADSQRIPGFHNKTCYYLWLVKNKVKEFF
jgi:hypothetical protein